jgi:hypothetical protein
MAESAFVVCVPEAERCVGALRERFDASVKLGVPAHITVLVPFMSPERIDEAVLQRVCHALREVPAFSFKLLKAQRFSATAYLAPEPDTPFIAHGPIVNSCASVSLLENSSGIWREMHAFALLRPTSRG